MSFIRPDASAQLLRWREALVGAALLGLGLWWALTGANLLIYVGIACALIGFALIAIGLQRGRFRIPGQGPGVVRVTEAQIAYFGPLNGGVVDLAELSELKLDSRGRPAHWVLSQPTEADLFIPVTAEGADALFDAFARLPGLKTEHMLSRLKAADKTISPVWTSQPDHHLKLK